MADAVDASDAVFRRTLTLRRQHVAGETRMQSSSSWWSPAYYLSDPHGDDIIRKTCNQFHTLIFRQPPNRVNSNIHTLN